LSPEYITGEKKEHEKQKNIPSRPYGPASPVCGFPDRSRLFVYIRRYVARGSVFIDTGGMAGSPIKAL
jgi:hypothetical protein